MPTTAPDAPDPATPARRRARAPAAAPAAVPFEELLERHGRGVLRLCVARLGTEAGEDAFQETLIAALRGLDDLRTPEAAGAWLFAIAGRKIVDAARARARRPVPTDALEEHVAVWHDPEDHGGIWAEVARLPPKQREAVGLRYLADLPHEDVAVVMGTSVEAARRNVFEGLRRLRGDLADRRDDL